MIQCAFCPCICIPSVRCSESSMLVSLRLCLKGESKKCSRAPRGLEESRGVLRRDVLLSRAMRPPSIKSETLLSVPLSPCTEASQLLEFQATYTAVFYFCLLFSSVLHSHRLLLQPKKEVDPDLEPAFGGLTIYVSIIGLHTLRTRGI